MLRNVGPWPVPRAPGTCFSKRIYCADMVTYNVIVISLEHIVVTVTATKKVCVPENLDCSHGCSSEAVEDA